MRLLLSVAVALASVPAAAHRAPLPYSPEVLELFPAGGQRGTEVQVAWIGRRLLAPEGVLCTRAGIEVVAVAAGERPDRCTVTLRLAADCPLGAHPLRLRTASGLSNIALFHVGVLPEVAVAAGSSPQVLALGCTANGRLEAGGCDRFDLDVEAGARVRCEVEAFRLGFGAIDLALSVEDVGGREVAASDDTALGRKDPMVAFTAAVAGRYRLQVRTAFVAPENRGPYRLHVGTFPRPLVALPLGGPPGATLAVELRGDGPSWRAAATLPDLPDSVFAFFPEDASGGTAPTPVYLRVGGPSEREPTMDGERALVSWPGSVSGTVAEPDQAVRFFFHAEKGDELLFRVLARTLRSALDPLLVLRQADGRYLAANDDQAGLGMDCALRFRAAATGDYQVEVRDVLRGGSPEHVFRLEAERPSESLGVRLAVGRRQDAAIVVPQGGRMGGVLQLTGADQAAGLELSARNLPVGVRGRFGPLRRGVAQVPVLFDADAEVPRQHALVEFGALAPTPPSERAVPFAQSLPLVLGRNDQPLVTAVQRALPIAVTEPAPFALSVQAPAVPIVRDAPLGVTVRVQRAMAMKDRVRLRALWVPPGVSAGEVVVEPGQSEATLPLSANGSAMLGEFPLAVIGTVYARGGRLEAASDFVGLTVEEPWVVGKLATARTESGKTIELRATLEARHPLGGKVRLRLLGLPRGATAEAIELEPNATAATFTVRVEATAAAGRYGGVLVEALAPSPNGDVVCRFGGGELRIDAPLPAADGGGGGMR